MPGLRPRPDVRRGNGRGAALTDGRINGLDLFSGIGGMSLALAPWVRPVAYCEIDAYCRGLLASRFVDGQLPPAPIWDDVSTLVASSLPEIDIIYGGFPCQDISVAGLGAGLDGERSGLFFEIERLIGDLAPPFVFLENVPAIRTRGAAAVGGCLADYGYDCRWGSLSAFDVGAPHKRERWWLLAFRSESFPDAIRKQLRHEQGWGGGPGGQGSAIARDHGAPEPLADAASAGQQGAWGLADAAGEPGPFVGGWWDVEPSVGRVAHGVRKRVDRLRGLGNAVVPAQAREAFRRLMGL